MAVLTAPARLLDQFADAVRATSDSLAIRDLRFTRIRIHLEFAEHPIANDLQMQLAHACNDGLAGIFMGVNAEGWILFREPLQRYAHFFLIQLRLRLDRH